MRLNKILLLLLITSSLHSQQFLDFDLNRAQSTFTVSDTSYALDDNTRDELIIAARKNATNTHSQFTVRGGDVANVWFWDQGDTIRFEIEDGEDTTYEFGAPRVEYLAWRQDTMMEKAGERYSIQFPKTRDSEDLRYTINVTQGDIWREINSSPLTYVYTIEPFASTDVPTYLSKMSNLRARVAASNLEEMSPTIDSVSVRLQNGLNDPATGRYGRDRLSIPQNSKALIRISTRNTTVIPYVYLHEAGHAFHYLAMVGGENNSLIREWFNDPAFQAASDGYWKTNENEFFAEIVTAYVGEIEGGSLAGYIQRDSYYQNTIRPKLDELFNSTTYSGVRGRYGHKYTGTSSTTLSGNFNGAGHLNSSRINGDFSSWEQGGTLHIGNDITTIRLRNSSTIWLSRQLQDVAMGDYIYYEPPN